MQRLLPKSMCFPLLHKYLHLCLEWCVTAKRKEKRKAEEKTRKDTRNGMVSTLERQTGSKLKRFESANGGAYNNALFEKWFAHTVILTKVFPP